jgi:beta-galactosidase/beta-glucuronidase
MRKIALGKDESGVTRMMLNGEPVFQYGPLDQGFWPDGIYTPPSYAAMCADLDAIQRMGCNMLRKHVKVEPQRWYYWADKLGMLVWQDMPNMPEYKPVEDAAAVRGRVIIAVHRQQNLHQVHG